MDCFLCYCHTFCRIIHSAGLLQVHGCQFWCQRMGQRGIPSTEGTGSIFRCKLKFGMWFVLCCTCKTKRYRNNMQLFASCEQLLQQVTPQTNLKWVIWGLIFQKMHSQNTGISFQRISSKVKPLRALSNPDPPPHPTPISLTYSPTPIVSAKYHEFVCFSSNIDL